jgi:hypothetical protein
MSFLDSLLCGREAQDEESMANLSVTSADTTFAGLKIGQFTLIQNKQVNNAVDVFSWCTNMDLLAVISGKNLSVFRLNWEKLMSIELDDLRYLLLFCCLISLIYIAPINRFSYPLVQLLLPA